MDAVRRALPQIARAVGLIANALKRGGQADLCRRGHQRTHCGPRCGGVSTHLQRRSQDRAVHHGGRARGPGLGGGGERRFPRTRQARNGEEKPGRNDVIVGIAASGRTPFTIAAVEYARSKGAQTISVTCNRNTPLQKAAQLAIVTEVGPEVISGSTRMKAGTAQKMVLNMLSSGAMTRLGYVYGNLMVNVTPRNSKLAARRREHSAAGGGSECGDCRQGFAGGGKQRAGGAGHAAGGSGPPGSGAGAEIGRRACAAGDRGGAQFVA